VRRPECLRRLFSKNLKNIQLIAFQNLKISLQISISIILLLISIQQHASINSQYKKQAIPYLNYGKGRMMMMMMSKIYLC